MNNIILQSFKVQSMATSEIMSLIPEADLKRIKEKDSSPLFQAFSICHEGVSTPRVIGEGAKQIHWTRKAVQSLKGIIEKGVKFFLGHNSDNSTVNRESVGEVVASTQKEIDGKLHEVVIGYFPNKGKVSDQNVCSMEASWNLFESAGKLFADSIDKITGIALSNSTLDTPAFSGAKRLGSVQAFENKDGEEPKKEPEPKINKGDLIMTFEEVKKAVKDMNIFPYQLFSQDEIRNDKSFGGLVEKAEKFDGVSKALNLQDGETAINKATSILEKYKGLEVSQNKLMAKSRLETIISSIKLTDTEKKFINKSFENNVDTIQDLSETGLKSFVEGQQKNYQDVTAILGVSKDGVSIPAGDDKDDNSVDKDDFSKASNNELLDEDFDE